LIFKCNYCNAKPFPHFKALVDHYLEYHSDMVERYSIKRTDRKASALIYATAEKEAIDATGWKEKDCKIEIFKQDEIEFGEANK